MSSPPTTAIADSNGFVHRLMNAFGASNALTSLGVCGWGRAGATRCTFGMAAIATGAGGAMPDIVNSGCLILWGYSPSYSRLTHATAVTEAVKRGMRLIVVDPRRVGLANKADVWLRVRPGTDGALVLGIANVMIQRGWYDRDLILTWSNGPHLVRADTGRLLTARDLSADVDARQCFAWDASARLVSYDTTAVCYDGDIANLALAGEYRIATRDGEVVCHPSFELYARLGRRYPAEVVEDICWIPRAQVEEAARLIWHSRPVSYYAWSGHEQHANVTQTACCPACAGGPCTPRLIYIPSRQRRWVLPMATGSRSRRPGQRPRSCPFQRPDRSPRRGRSVSTAGGRPAPRSMRRAMIRSAQPART